MTIAEIASGYEVAIDTAAQRFHDQLHSWARERRLVDCVYRGTPQHPYRYEFLFASGGESVSKETVEVFETEVRGYHSLQQVSISYHGGDTEYGLSLALALGVTPRHGSFHHSLGFPPPLWDPSTTPASSPD